MTRFKLVLIVDKVVMISPNEKMALFINGDHVFPVLDMTNEDNCIIVTSEELTVYLFLIGFKCFELNLTCFMRVLQIRVKTFYLKRLQNLADRLRRERNFV